MRSASITLLLAVALSTSWSWLGNQQPESIASGNELRSNVRASVSTEQRQNVTIKGDIVVDSGTYLIENVNLNLTGGIIASNDATVILRNATLSMKVYLGIVLADRSKFVAENASIVVNSTSRGSWSEMILHNETTMNITDSDLYGHLYIIGRQNSRIYITNSILKGPDPSDMVVCGVIMHDNSTARIQDSELDTAQAQGNSSIYINGSNSPTSGVYAGGSSLVEIENSFVEYVDSTWSLNNSTLRISNSTVDGISFNGLTLTVEGSKVTNWLQVQGNSTAWLTNVSASAITVIQNATLWLINSYSGTINTRDQGKVNVGWQAPLFGIVAVPHNWIPILQGIAVLAAIIVIIALLVVLNRRWSRWRQWKLKERALLSDRS